jgi:hypothetical protein
MTLTIYELRLLNEALQQLYIKRGPLVSDTKNITLDAYISPQGIAVINRLREWTHTEVTRHESESFDQLQLFNPSNRASMRRLSGNSHYTGETTRADTWNERTKDITVGDARRSAGPKHPQKSNDDTAISEQ